MQNNNWSAFKPMCAGFLGLFFLIGGVGSWATMAEISGAIIATGQIEVDQNRQIVQHPAGGVTAQLMVKEGDRVQAGQILLRLDDSDIQSELSIVESQLFEIMARRGRLQSERDGLDVITFDPLLINAARNNDDIAGLVAGQERLLLARATSISRETSQLRKQTDQILDQISGITAQQKALEEQVSLIQEDLINKQSLLSRGLGQSSPVLSLRIERAKMDGALGALKGSLAEAHHRISENEIQILKLQSQRREDAIKQLRDIQSRELEMRERRVSLRQKLAQLDIQAPVSGIIYGLKVFTIRSVIQPAEPILYVIPQDRPLVIGAKVEAIHIDKLTNGQDVTLRLSALDQRRTPELTGQVNLISADVFTDETTRQPYYKVEIILDESEQNKLAEGIRLVPGMPVEVFIKTGDMAPITYLTKPFVDYFSKAFR